MREPAWQVDVCDGSGWVTEPSRQGGQGAMEAIADEDERFPSYNCSSGGGSPIGLPAEPRIEQIDHAGLDTELSQSMKGFNCPKGHLISSHAFKKNTAEPSASLRKESCGVRQQQIAAFSQRCLARMMCFLGSTS